MFCPKCGKETDASGKFCQWCGTDIEAIAPKAMMKTEPEEEEEETPRIVRTKRFQVAPMDEEEAIEQMELLGHDFFIFFNVDANGINVIYRRQDGNYGLLEPELA